MSTFISIIIPNHNGALTIDHSLQAIFNVSYDNYEVIVVDDCSTDNSCQIIRTYPCRLLQFTKQSGASAARNAGAQLSTGKLLFFIDSDCVMRPDALTVAAQYFQPVNDYLLLGGTYTRQAFDHDFFSNFQAGFINYSETKHQHNPDYVASHAMIISTKAFAESGGFPVNFMPILEDVEFSHRLKNNGLTLQIDERVLVQHFFNFTLFKSLANAYRKTKYWVMYSLDNKDILADSGTASRELKINVILFVITMLLVLSSHLAQSFYFFAALPFLFIANFLTCKKMLEIFHTTHGLFFTIKAFIYYSLIYPIPICLGTSVGFYKHYLARTK